MKYNLKRFMERDGEYRIYSIFWLLACLAGVLAVGKASLALGHGFHWQLTVLAFSIWGLTSFLSILSALEVKHWR